MENKEDKTKFELRYLVIPNFLYKETRMSLTALKVYCFIHAYTNPFFFSNEHLGEMFDCHSQTISTALGQLKEFGYIKIYYTPKDGGGKIRLSVDAHSDGAKPLSGFSKSEPTTERNHSDKEGKVNNKKEKIFKEPFIGNNAKDLNSDWSKISEARKLIHAKKQPFNSCSPSNSASPSRDSPLYPKKERTVSDGRGII